MKVLRTLLIAVLGAAPVCAQQVEQKTDRQNPSAQSDPSHSRDPDRTQPEQKAVAYIGLLTREVPPELRAQFSLAEGFGLLVNEVLPDSPAKAAGLKVYDVLVKFEDQQLVNMEQFMSLVRARKKGDVVQLDVITGGKATKVPVTLGEHMVTAHKEHPSHHQGGYDGRTQPNPQPSGQRFPSDQPRGFQNQGHGLQESMERFQKEMRDYQQRIQEWSKSGGNREPMPQAPQFSLPGHSQERGERHNPHRGQPQTGITIPPGTDLQQFNFSQSNATSNVTRRDDSGEYSIKTEGGKKTFTARPSNGPEKSWPINNDAERQAVPQEFRDKLRMMDDANGGIRIEINPGMNAPGNTAPNDGNPQSPPPVKKKTTSA